MDEEKMNIPAISAMPSKRNEKKRKAKTANRGAIDQTYRKPASENPYVKENPYYATVDKSRRASTKVEILKKSMVNIKSISVVTTLLSFGLFATAVTFYLSRSC